MEHVVSSYMYNSIASHPLVLNLCHPTVSLLFFLRNLKAPYSSKIDIFFIQERFSKLIYCINMIIKSGI